MENKVIRIRVIKIYIGILAICIPYLIFVLITDIKIPCISLLITGSACPSCGITRMFLSMVKLDFVQAFHYNPASFISFVAWNIIAVLYFWGKPKFIRNAVFLYVMFGFTLALIMILWIFRQLLT